MASYAALWNPRKPFQTWNTGNAPVTPGPGEIRYSDWQSGAMVVWPDSGSMRGAISFLSTDWREERGAQGHDLEGRPDSASLG